MRSIPLISILLAVFLVACGSNESAAPQSPTADSALTTLPATLEGHLAADVAEGDVDDGGYSEYNFGTLTVGETEILVQVSGSLLKSAGIPKEGGKVRAVLGSKTEEFGAATYTITSLDRL